MTCATCFRTVHAAPLRAEDQLGELDYPVGDVDHFDEATSDDQPLSLLPLPAGFILSPVDDQDIITASPDLVLDDVAPQQVEAAPEGAPFLWLHTDLFPEPLVSLEAADNNRVSMDRQPTLNMQDWVIAAKESLEFDASEIKSSSGENIVPVGLLCGICLTNQKDYRLDCGHLLCKECILMIFQEEDAKCPYDRTIPFGAPQIVYFC